MKMLFVSLAIGLTATGAWAQSARVSPGQYYEQMQQKRMATLSRDHSFVSGGKDIGGSVLRIGNTYEISDRRYAGEPQNVQVFDPMKPRLPQVLIDSAAVLSEGLSPGVNSIPQYIADRGSFGNKREQVAGLLPMFVPETILADWNNMWRSVGHGQTKDIWGGTVVRCANQVTYRSPGECQRGCTFSMLDNPMAVAAKVPSIRQYWEEHHAIALNGDLQGIEQDPWARGMRPIASDNTLANKLNSPTLLGLGSPLERLRVDPLTTWPK